MSMVFLIGVSGFLGGYLLYELFVVGYEVCVLLCGVVIDVEIVVVGGCLVYGDFVDVVMLVWGMVGCDVIFYVVVDISMWC